MLHKSPKYLPPKKLLLARPVYASTGFRCNFCCSYCCCVYSRSSNPCVSAILTSVCSCGASIPIASLKPCTGRKANSSLSSRLCIACAGTFCCHACACGIYGFTSASGVYIASCAFCCAGVLCTSGVAYTGTFGSCHACGAGSGGGFNWGSGGSFRCWQGFCAVVKILVHFSPLFFVRFRFSLHILQFSFCISHIATL